MNSFDGSEQVITEIVIRHLANGQVAVTGPIQNKVLMYGLLECAKDAVRDSVAKQEQPLIAPVTLGRSGFSN